MENTVDFEVYGPSYIGLHVVGKHDFELFFILNRMCISLYLIYCD